MRAKRRIVWRDLAPALAMVHIAVVVWLALSAASPPAAEAARSAHRVSVAVAWPADAPLQVSGRVIRRNGASLRASRHWRAQLQTQVTTKRRIRGTVRPVRVWRTRVTGRVTRSGAFQLRWRAPPRARNVRVRILSGGAILALSRPRRVQPAKQRNGPPVPGSSPASTPGVGATPTRGPATGPPVAAVQDDHLTVAPIESIPARVALLRDLAVTSTRVSLLWSEIAPIRPAAARDPSDDRYKWRRPDIIMRELAAANIDPIVSVHSAPAWATDAPPPAPDAAFNSASPRSADFADFMAAIATRYRGDFAPVGVPGPLPAVRHFELWNEPNLAAFLTPQVEDGRRVSLDNYAAMVKAAYPAVKGVNPHAVVIAGVGGPRSSTSETGTGALQWLRGLRDRAIPLDAYSQHIYPAAAPTTETDVVPTWSTVDLLLRELDGFGPGLPLYITEAGYTTAPTPFRRTKVTDEQQAEYVSQVYALPQLRTSRIPTVVWFNLQDNANWPGGLLRADLSRKPSYERFAAVVETQSGSRLNSLSAGAFPAAGSSLGTFERR